MKMAEPRATGVALLRLAAVVVLLLSRAPPLLMPVPFRVRVEPILKLAVPLRSSTHPEATVVAPEPSADALPTWTVWPELPWMMDVPPE